MSILRNSTIQIAEYSNIWNRKRTNTRRTIAKAIKNIFIVRKIIVRNIININKFEIYKNAKFAKIYTKFLIFDTNRDNSKKKKLEK